ncbi:MAG TPA: hypothetical protein V6D28_11440 [Leptolyngbyaceae cyanobacterium]
MISNASQIEDLIRSHNIFDGHQVVKKSQVWGESFPDVSSINSHASDAVFEAIGQVRRGQCQVRGITITADKGLGKSHILSRIRHRLQSERDILFIYMSEYEDLNKIKKEFLQTLASSLKQAGSDNITQWQEVAAALVNEAYKVYNKSYTPKQLVNRFPSALAKNPNILDSLISILLQSKSDVDPYLIKAIFWTLSQAHTPFATKWLSGEELAQSQADGMGLPTIAVDSSKMLCQILDLIGDYKIPLICFDEVDGAGCDSNGSTRPQVVASLVKDFYNQIKRGIFLTAMYPATWEFQVAYMTDANAVIDRMADFSAGKPIGLRNLNYDDIVGLISQRLKKLFEDNAINPPNPVYPFEEDELKKLARQGLNAREVLTWCAERIKKGKGPNPVELAFKEEFENLTDFMDDEDKIAQALIFSFNRIIGQTIEGVRVDKIEAPVTPRTNNIDFKVIGEENGNKVKIGVAVIQASGGVGISSGLKTLTEYQTYDLTRGCFVRSKTIPPTAKVAEQYRQKLVNEQGGEWVMLKEEEIKPLLAIWSVYQSRESRDLNEKEIFNFINEKALEKQLGASNFLIQEILSDPSGEVPQDLTNEDTLFEEATAVSSEANTASSQADDFFDDSGLDALLEAITKR